MLVNALIDGRPHVFDTEDSARAIGEGGEAVVLRWDAPADFCRKHGIREYVTKIFFTEGSTSQETQIRQAAAAVRQRRLRNFRKLPQNATSPVALATNSRGEIVGYVMPFIKGVPLSKYLDANWRRQNGITQQKVVRVLMNLHHLVSEVHKADVVIGDFNEKNVLVAVQTDEVYLIDMDSAQWDEWPSLVATPDFTDPTLLDANFNMKPGARYSQESDWYAYAVMVYQLLTLTHPYRDGIHRPVQEPGKPYQVTLRFPDRVTHRLSVFDRTVHLGTGVHRPASLPEALGVLMRNIFTKDSRISPFPLHLLTAFQWMTCPKCGREHGRTVCPNLRCKAQGVTGPTPAIIPTTTPATVAPAPTRQPAPPPPPLQNVTFVAVGKRVSHLEYVFHSQGAYRREDGTVVVRTALNPQLTSIVAGKRTVLAAQSNFAILNGDPQRAQQHETQVVLGQTTVAANSESVYWIEGDKLVRDDPRKRKVTIGTITPHLTSVWVGERFGVNLVQAGVILRVRTFGPHGFYGSYTLPPEFGTVVSAQCVIGDTTAWLMVAYRSKTGVITNKCYVFNAKAQLRATATARRAGTWLSVVSAPSLVVGEKLLVPVPGVGADVVSIQSDGSLKVEGRFAQLAPLVPDTQATVGLHLTAQGLIHVGRTRATTLPGY